jgi:O-antigen/teichoic acid export membrane protein
MKVKEFLKGLSWLIALNLIVKPVWIFGIDRQVQNELGHESYGFYFSIFNLSVILGILADAGLSNMFNRQLALREAPSFSRLISFKFLLSGLFLAAYFFVCWLTGIEVTTNVILVGLLQLLTSFLIFFRSIITGTQHFRSDAGISVLDKILMIIICGSFLYLPHAGDLTLTTFLVIQCACTGFAALVALAFAIRAMHGHAAGVTALSSILKLTWPFILLILLMSLHSRLDGFLLERLHPDGDYEAGIYAAAYRLLDAGNMVGYLAASFLVPYAARNIGDQQLINTTTMKLRHGLMVIAIPVAIICFMFSELIFSMLYYESDGQANVLGLCLLVLPAYYMIHLYGSLLTASGALMKFSMIMAVCVGLNIIFNLVLIPEKGALGACYSALLSQYFCAVLCWYFATTTLKLTTGWRSILAYCGWGIAIAVVCYLVKSSW